MIERFHCLEQFLKASAFVFLGLLLLPSEAIVYDADVVLASGREEVHQLDYISLLEVEQLELLNFRDYFSEDDLGLLALVVGLLGPLINGIFVGVDLCKLLLCLCIGKPDQFLLRFFDIGLLEFVN